MGVGVGEGATRAAHVRMHVHTTHHGLVEWGGGRTRAAQRLRQPTKTPQIPQRQATVSPAVPKLNAHPKHSRKLPRAKPRRGHRKPAARGTGPTLGSSYVTLTDIARSVVEVAQAPTKSVVHTRSQQLQDRTEHATTREREGRSRLRWRGTEEEEDEEDEEGEKKDGGRLATECARHPTTSQPPTHFLVTFFPGRMVTMGPHGSEFTGHSLTYD
jgi:hypothetical protein